MSSDNRIKFGGYKHIHPSKKHYRPQHYKINKHVEYFDNDILYFHSTDSVYDSEGGINKEFWKFHDYCLNDDYKDGNK